MRKYFAFASFVIFILCCVGQAFGVELVRDKKAVAEIVVQSKADEVTLFAAGELQKYIRKISGVELPINELSKCDKAKANIYLGLVCNNIADDLPPKPRYQDDDRFVIRIIGKDVCIAGSCSRGTLFGVYAFLEKLGCRWLLPDEPAGLIPTKNNIDWTINEIKEEASFPYRIAWILQKQNFLELADLFCKQRCNVCIIRDNHLLYPDGKNYAAQVMPVLRKRGMQIMIAGHSFDVLMENDADFNSHPQWRPLMDGKRITSYKQGVFTSKTNFCVSNPDAVNAFLKAIDKQLLDVYPDVNLWSLWSADGIQGWCQCEDCVGKIGEPTNQAYYIHNLVAKHIKEHLGKRAKYFYLAYLQNAVVPDFEKIEKLAGGRSIDYVWYALMGKCYYHSICQSDGCKMQSHLWPDNPKAKAMNMNQFYLDQFKQYLEHFNGNGIIYEYFWTPRYRCLFRPLSRNIDEDVKYYCKLPMAGMSNQSKYPGFDTVALNYALHHRLLWNCSQNMKEFKADYLQSLYGPQWQKVAEIYDEYENRAVIFKEAQHCLPAELASGTGDFLNKSTETLENLQGKSQLNRIEIEKLRLMIKLSKAVFDGDMNSFKKIAPDLVRHNIIEPEIFFRPTLKALGAKDDAQIEETEKWLKSLAAKKP